GYYTYILSSPAWHWSLGLDGPVSRTDSVCYVLADSYTSSGCRSSHSCSSLPPDRLGSAMKGKRAAQSDVPTDRPPVQACSACGLPEELCGMRLHPLARPDKSGLCVLPDHILFDEDSHTGQPFQLTSPIH